MSEFTRSAIAASGRLSASVFGQAINLIGQIAVIPLFLHLWTKQIYGEWLLLTAIPNLLWSLEGGMAGLAINRMVLSTSVGNWQAANRLFQNVVVVQVILSAAILSAGLLVAGELDIVRLFHITEMSRATAQFVLVTMLSYMVLGWGVSLLKAPYYAAGKSVRGLWLWTLWRLFDLLSIMGALLLHCDARGVAVAQTVNAAAWLIFGTYDLRRHCKDFSFALSAVSWCESKTVVRDGVPYFLNQAGNAFFMQGYPLVIGWFLSPLAVVNFTVARTLSRVLSQCSSVVGLSLSPELSANYARKNWDLYLRWVAIIIASAIVGAVVTCALLPTLGPMIVKLWTHGSVTLGPEIFLFFAISVSLQGFWMICYTQLAAANKHHLQCILFFATTVCALGACAFTLGRFGLIAAPIVMVLADAVLLVGSVLLAFRAFPEIPFRKIWRLLDPMLNRIPAEMPVQSASRPSGLATLPSVGTADPRNSSR